MLAVPVVAVDAADRWLLAFSIAAVVVLAAGSVVRRAARRGPRRAHGTEAPELPPVSPRRSFRRRGGAVLALGPLVGLAFAPTFGSLAVVLALGAVALATLGLAVEQSRHAVELSTLGTAVAAAVAVAAGATFGPTGVDALDRILAFVVIVVVVRAVDGMGNVDGLAPGLGAAATAAAFALAAFAHQNGLATVVAGSAAACVAFLAFNLPPASLFVGRTGRLVIGWVVAVGALAVAPAPGPWRSLLTPTILLGVVLLDAVVVVVSRLRRRQRLLEHRADHLVHRLGRRGRGTGEAGALLVLAQVLLGGIALFTGRGVLPEWLGAGVTAAVLLVLGVTAARAQPDREPAPGLPKRAWVVIVVVVVALVVAVLPTALAANRAADLMLDGKDAASQGLTAARSGDSATAKVDFDQAEHDFASARDKLASKALSPGLAVPGVAPNLRAARTLAAVGTDLAQSGSSIATAVDPDALKVVDGRLPLEAVKQATPALQEGATALASALHRIDGITHDPYLAPQVSDAIDQVHGQLVQAEREARHASAAAQLAPAIFGGDGPRTYLFVVQNNAESRATGGLIGDYGLITAVDGKLHVSDTFRTSAWNDALRALPNPTVAAPADYLRRYTQYSPNTTLQNINMSPDFPSVAQALTGLAQQAGADAGLGPIDGVLAVDPAGLAALLQLTGPVTVDQWPVPIGADNVVDVALRDQYVVYGDDLTGRVDFLGDVAKAAVDKATSGSLGKPAEIAKVLGAAAHSGHLTLAFTRPDEQHLAEELGAAQEMTPVRSDAFALTTSNVGGNKLDFYMKRDIDYRVTLRPNSSATEARANAEVSAQFDNTAPDTGPPYAIGPHDARFVAGQNRLFISLYSPLTFEHATWDGTSVDVSPGRERGRNVYSLFEDVFSMQTKTMTAKLGGTVKLHDGWYDLQVRQQPTVNPDRVHVSVEVPDGWRIDRAPKMEVTASGAAARTSVDLTKTTNLRVHLVRDTGTWDLWGRLQAGR